MPKPMIRFFPFSIFRLPMLYTDVFKVKRIREVTICLFLLLSPSIFANPFQKIHAELADKYPQTSGSMFRIFAGSSDQEVLNLFSVGKNMGAESDGIELASLDIPKHLPVSPVVSNTVVHESGIIVKKHTVQKKDTLLKVARTFGVDVSKLKKQNNLTSDNLKIGQVLEVPVQVKNASSSRIITRKLFVNPVPQSRLTSRFGRRVDPFNKYNRVYHSGLDLAAKVGAPVLSAADGEVVFTGRNGGYGNSVIIEHKNGFKTVYAHCSQILVEVGESVRMGRVIALVGRTGTATGAHLHFEVFRNGKLMNPEVALGMTEKEVTKLPKSEVAGM